VAVFALSAMAASVASAQQGFFTSDGPVTLTVTENAGGVNATTMFGLTIKCPGSTYTGHKYNVTPHTFIPNGSTNGSTTVTMTPHYKQIAANGDANCRMTPGNFPVTIHMNSCDYVAHLGATTGGANTYGITLNIICPQGNEITLTTWTTDHEHTTKLEPFCVIHVGPQTGLIGGHAADTTNGTVDLSGTIEGIKATRTPITGTHTLLCPESTTSTAKLDINLTVKGINEAGGSTSIGISE
jgi:hypothetical protein